MINWPKSDYWQSVLPGLRGRTVSSIDQLCSLSAARDHAILFISTASPDLVGDLLKHKGCLIVASERDRALCEPLEEVHALLYCEDPRYRFAEILLPLWSDASLRGGVMLGDTECVGIGKRAAVDPTAIVEPFVTVGEDSVVGPGAYVMSGARIGPNVRIGASCTIRENAVIGGYGFGYAMAVGKPALRMPHVGGVRIGSNVEIGALTTVCAGTFDPTVISDGVRVDDHCHVAHNCQLGSDVMVVASSTICGSVTVGERSWLGPNCTIRDRIAVGADCIIGMGAVVTKSAPDGSTLVGNPARAIGPPDGPSRRASEPSLGRS